MYRLSLSLLLISIRLWAGPFAPICEDLIGESVPLLKRVDAFGNRFDMSGLIGKVLIISIGDKKANVKESLWYTWETLYLFPEDVVFINIYYPGGISFTVPRGEVVHRIRKKINKCVEEILSKSPPDRREFLERLEIHWIIDWKRNISWKFKAPRHKIVTYLVDKKGIVRDYYLYDYRDKGSFIQCVKQVVNE